MATTVDEIMTGEVIAVDGETSLQRVLELMVKHRVKSLPVVDGRRNLVGIIAREDVMRAMERTALRQYPPIIPFQAA
jgi:CBS domain-containing protein